LFPKQFITSLAPQTKKCFLKKGSKDMRKKTKEVKNIYNGKKFAKLSTLDCSQPVKRNGGG
jgi:hypothetical protein